jgi:glyoxylase-like metal-dependent hydrolase (beta-lactamase superfamily II)
VIFNAGAAAVGRAPFCPRIEDLYCAPWGEEIRRLRPARVTAMIFRQLFDSVSSTYTYLIASRRGGEALIIDPVLEKVDRYIQLVDELDLRLVKAVDTHLHADHITGLGALRDAPIA